MVSGNNVVWQDARNGQSDINAKNLATGVEIPVCVNTATQYYPAIDGWAEDLPTPAVGEDELTIKG